MEKEGKEEYIEKFVAVMMKYDFKRVNYVCPICGNDKHHIFEGDTKEHGLRRMATYIFCNTIYEDFEPRKNLTS